MPFSSTLLFGVSLFAAAVAQNTTLIAFTTLPGSSIKACDPVQLAWSGGDGSSPVTITLKQGLAANLATVAIITGDATGSSYTWTPDSTLSDATDYALQISQGVNDINYSGIFALTGGSSSSSCSAANATTTSSTPATTAIVVVGPTGNATIVNPTVFTTTLAGTAGTAASSGGTGIPMSRNTTFSTASLSSTATDTGATTTGTGATTTTGGAGAGTATGTAGSTSASASPTSAADSKGFAGSSLALVLCAVVGMWVLN